MGYFSKKASTLRASFRPVLLATALVAIAAGFASPARADDDDWGEHRGWQNHEWREHEWREHEWREEQWRRHEAQEEREREIAAWRAHEWREHQPYGYVVPGYGYGPPVVYGPPPVVYAPGQASVDFVFPIHIR